MNLSKRLSKVLEYVNEFDKVADIGADHGYLSIAMLEKGVKFVQVVENKTEPFLRAQSALMGYENVIFSLSDGISDLHDDINTVTICGMGGLNIVEILGSQLIKARRLNKIILQANSKLLELRKFLTQEHFEIIDEEIVEEKDTYYEIIVCKYNENYQTNISYTECYFGPVLLKKQSTIFIEKYQNVLKMYEEILRNNKISKQEDIDYIKTQIELICNNVRF